MGAIAYRTFVEIGFPNASLPFGAYSDRGDYRSLLREKRSYRKSFRLQRSSDLARASHAKTSKQLKALFTFLIVNKLRAFLLLLLPPSLCDTPSERS